ncbi:MAG: FmdE family protein [Methanomicrobiales archaeon]|nr:FmdE family protein [Methanomicrobiales archaeon]
MCENNTDSHIHANPHTHDEYPSFDECVRFHGHSCPGLAMGYRAATAGMRRLGVKRPYDEELVCIAETDACGVDAIQMITGCTSGKGNLIVHDYGKHVFTLISRESGRAVRILVRQVEMPEREAMDEMRRRILSGTADEGEEHAFRRLMGIVTERMLKCPETEMLEVRDIEIAPPAKARIFTSVACACCGEPVADARIEVIDGARVCIPCAKKVVRR